MNYAVGDTVTYATFGGGLRTGIITHKHDDVENGEAGFDMVIHPSTSSLLPAECYWGYDDQITDVRPA
jgi:hypothetical protein